MKNIIIIKINIPRPVNVLKSEKLGTREISKDKRKFAKDSSIVGRFDMRAINPTSF